VDNSFDVVRKYYESDPQREWMRLIRHRFEMPVTWHFLTRYLSPGSAILDDGAGPGRYSIELAKCGHKVDLLDLSEANVEFASSIAVEKGAKLNGLHVGNAIDLSRFRDSIFDAVILFGPMYHLLEIETRKRAIEEAIRVLKNGGLLAVAFISSYSAVYDILNKDPSYLLGDWDQIVRCKKTDIFKEGKDKVFTDAYYIDPFEVEEYMSQFGLSKLSIIGAEGLTAQSQSVLAKQSEDVIQEWIRLAIELAETKGAIASSIHVVYFGKKQNSVIGELKIKSAL
jgi:SAM-dependent methyltransferase